MAEKPELVQPPAVQMNARRIVAVGTLLFFLAFLVLLAVPAHRDWMWTSLAGTGLGVLGWSIMTNHRRMGRTI